MMRPIVLILFALTCGVAIARPCPQSLSTNGTIPAWNTTPPIDNVEPSDQYDASGIVSGTTEAAIEALLNLIPGVGGFLGDMVSIFWPESNPQTPTPEQIWDSIQSYAVNQINMAIEEATLNNVFMALQGIQTTIQYYNSLPFASAEKQQYFTTIINTFNDQLPQFVDDPEHTLPYLVPFGCLALAFQRELVVNYTSIYNGADPNAAANLQDLQSAIGNLMNVTFQGMQAQMNTRLNAITMENLVPGGQDCEGQGNCGVFVVQDTVTGYNYQQWWQEMEGSPWTETTANQYMQSQYNALRQSAIAQLNAQLDAFTAPMRLWPLLDPTFNSTSANSSVTYNTGMPPFLFNTGMFGGSGTSSIYSMTPSNNPPDNVALAGFNLNYNPGGYLQQLSAWWDNTNDGSQSNSLNIGNYNNKYPLNGMNNLDEDTFINLMAFSYTANGFYDMLLSTNNGQSVAFNGVADSDMSTGKVSLDFSASLLNVRLCGLAGGADGNEVVAAVDFLWCAEKLGLVTAYPYGPASFQLQT